MKIIKLLCVSVIAALVIIAGFLVHLFKVYPKADYTVPFTSTENDYHIESVDGINLLVYHNLPYPTDFEASTYPAQNLGGTWKMKTDPNDTGMDDGWQHTTEPGDDWMDIVVPSSYVGTDGSFSNYRGVTWYFLDFSSDLNTDTETFTRLGFDGVHMCADVWLNGTYLGGHRGGDTPFYFDVSDHLERNKNILIVRSDNRPDYDTLPVKTWERQSPERECVGGIHRDVVLESIPRHYICKAVADMSLSKNKGDVSVSVVIHNHDLTGPYILSGALISPDGEEIDLGSYIFESSDEFELHTLKCEVDNPKTWSPNHPRLYRLMLTLKTKSRVETLETKTGFRTVRIVGYGTDPGVYINDINTFIRGVSRYEDVVDSGSEPMTDNIAKDLGLIQDMNANFIRMAHSSHDVREIRACRDLGIMVSEEIPYNNIGMGWVDWYNKKGTLFELPVRTFGMRQLNDPHLMSLAQRMLIEMVERDINNPAVIIWIAGSESYTLFDEGGRFHGWMRDVIRSFDSTRPVCTFEYTYDIRLLDAEKRAAPSMDLIAVDSSSDLHAGGPEDLGLYLDRIHRRYPDRLLFLSDFCVPAGLDCIDADGTYSEEDQAMLIEEYMEIARSKNYIAGVCPAVFADSLYPGDSAPFLHSSGVMTSGREPKAAYDVLTQMYHDIKTNGR
ncbi:MAG: hypothetical protein JW885_06490 [Deltaproteobacteria bacterium]|nr:hypothetical protein [Candidatus Zymogenaceae bacterium]